MNSPSYFRILPVVTGKGEETFFPKFMRNLVEGGKCCFVEPRRIGQLSPRKSERPLEMVGKGKKLTNRQEELGLIARRFLSDHQNNLVIVIDDLEGRGRQLRNVYDTYRKALDTMLVSIGQSNRASVHFMVTMIEACYFGDHLPVAEVLGINLDKFEGDPETIPNPKSKLKQLCGKSLRKFDEKGDGMDIVTRLDLDKVLSDKNTCRSLRSLFKWCSRRIGEDDTERFQLLDGEVCPVTGEQV